jgi:hypothetical protein
MTTPTDSLPTLQDALLDAGLLASLFRDLSGLVEIDEILLKGEARSHTSECSVSLEEAREALENGRVLGVQIRYRYEGSPWWDTLLRTPHGIRLVADPPRRRCPWGLLVCVIGKNRLGGSTRGTPGIRTAG